MRIDEHVCDGGRVCYGVINGGCGLQEDDEAHAEVAQQVRVEIRAEAAPPAVISPLVVWWDFSGVLAEGVAENKLARHDDVEGAIELAGVRRKLEWCKCTEYKRIHQGDCQPCC